MRALLIATVLIFCERAHAQDLEPREFANIPIGLNFLIAGYAYLEGEVSVDSSVPLQDAELTSDNAVLAYARSIDFWGRSGKVDVVLPYAWIEGTATLAGEPVERHVHGFGDPRLRLSVNLLGAPSLSLEEYQRWEQDTILGASVRVTAPLGQYDDDRLVNVGTNRWSIKPEIGVSKRWGRVTLELTSAVTMYSDNRDFLADLELPQDPKREQDPLYSFRTHLIYSFPYAIWASLDATYYVGGETTVGGVESDDQQRNTRLGATLGFPLSRRHSIKLYASTGVSERLGGDFDLYGIAWQVRWGAGL